MKIKQFSIFNPENLEESLQQGEYYIWTVHFADGTSQKVKITSDELTQADLEKHFGKPVKDIDYNWGIQGGGMGDDSNFNRQYHSDQDRIEQQTRDSNATKNRFEEEVPSSANSDPERRRDEWRKNAPALNDPSRPERKEYAPFNHDEWMRTSKKMEGYHSNTIGAIADAEVPVVGDTIRTRKMQMEGKVEKVEGRTVFFRVGDGRLMKTSVNNTIVIQKLADEDHEMVESELNEISNALLTKYKSVAGKSASSADAMGDIKTGNKRFSGIVKATNKQFANDAKKATAAVKEGSVIREFHDESAEDELKFLASEWYSATDDYVYAASIEAELKKLGWVASYGDENPYIVILKNAKTGATIKYTSEDLDIGDGVNEGGMGGLNRCAPAVDVSYEKVLNRNPQTKYSKVVGEDTVLDEVTAKWLEEQQLNELSRNTLKRYSAAAGRSMGNDMNDARSAMSTADDYRRHGNDARGDKWDDERNWLDARAEKRAGNIANATTKIARKIDELSVGTLKNYAGKARSTKPEHDRVKTVNHIRGYHKANDRIASKTGDRREHPTYEGRLEEFLNLDEKDSFADILNKQHAADQAAKPKPATKEIPYHNWKIRYRPAAQAGDKVAWQVMDKNGEIKHKGESMSDRDAVGDAEEWINQGGGTKQASSSNVTIDFNVDFAKQFAPGGEQFHASIDTDNGVPILILSTMPQKGLKNSHIRTQADKTTSGTTRLPVITMSAKEANASGLQPNGRYILGDKDPIDNDTAMFPLIYQGTVQGKGDMMKMGKPGLTVAHPREAMHESGTLSGMEEVPFSELVRDTIATHGLRWAVEYYVKKHKIPAKQFRIYAGI